MFYSLFYYFKGFFVIALWDTSEGGGMRHALEEGSDEIQFEGAKFVLVSCSAFINYLIVKCEI